MGNEVSAPAAAGGYTTALLPFSPGAQTVSPQAPNDLAAHSTAALTALKTSLGLFNAERLQRLADPTLTLLIYIRAPLESSEAPPTPSPTPSPPTPSWSRLEVLGHALVREQRVAVPPGRCTDAQASVLLVHELEVSPQHRRAGHGTALVARLRSHFPSALALWAVRPDEDALEFARVKIMGPEALAAWFVLHRPGEDAAGAAGAAAASPPTPFPFPFKASVDTAQKAVERVHAYITAAAAEGNWDVRTMLKQFAEFLAGAAVGMEEEHATALALLSANEIFNAGGEEGGEDEEDDEDDDGDNDANEEDGAEDDEEDEAEEEAGESTSPPAASPESAPAAEVLAATKRKRDGEEEEGASEGDGAAKLAREA